MVIAVVGVVSACSPQQQAANPTADRATETVSAFAKQKVNGTAHWAPDQLPEGPTLTGRIKGIGDFTTDAQGTTVLSAVLESKPVQGAAALTDSQLLDKASGFATAHVQGVDQMQLYEHRLVDEGVATIFFATWREKEGSAWLPRRVMVGLYSEGTPVEFAYVPTRVSGFDATAKVTSEAATAAALKAVANSTPTGDPPELTVLTASGLPTRLAWQVAVFTQAPGVAREAQIVNVDAKTGAPIPN